jgi:Cu(I)/Ag(I) efflux system membrane fusion protein
VLAIPAHVLIRTGTRGVVMVSLDSSRFQAREIEIGRETGEWVEVLQGVKVGERIVVNAQFLLDAESNLRAAVARLQGESSTEETHAR